jgi:hypothetical protein
VDANLTPGAAGKGLRARFVSGLLQSRSALLSHLSAITLLLDLYVHNDVMQAFGTPEFEISIAPVANLLVFPPIHRKPLGHPEHPSQTAAPMESNRREIGNIFTPRKLPYTG